MNNMVTMDNMDKMNLFSFSSMFIFFCESTAKIIIFFEY